MMRKASTMLPSRSLGSRVGVAALLSLALVACAEGGREGDPAGPLLVGVSTDALRPSVAFGVGSLIVPMDNTGGGSGAQQTGILRAYGFVYRLLTNNIPVQWAVTEGKVFGGVDVTATTTINGGSQTPTSRTYAGGPFIVDAAYASQALTILGTFNNGELVKPTQPRVNPDNGYVAPNVVVHVATASFTTQIARGMTAAPRIAVIADGYEDIAFGYLNAAGIRDSQGNVWPQAIDPANSYPGRNDILSLAQVAGAQSGSLTPPDGALIRTDGTPAFCHVTSMHYSLTGTNTTEVVREVRAWLLLGPTTHAYMQCAATQIYENDANGKFLTTNGIRATSPQSNVTNNAPDNPLAQYVEGFSPDTGTVGRIDMATGSAFLDSTNVKALINQTGAATQAQIYWMTGNAYAATSNGRVTYLAGHDFSNNQTSSAGSNTRALANAVRLFLNSLLDSPCASAEGQPTPSISMTGATLTNQSSVTYTINWANGGPGIADSATITYVLPTGYTFTSATASGTYDSGTRTVTWTLGNLKASTSGSVAVTVGIAADGSYNNTASLNYFVSVTPRTLASAVLTTVRDTVAPDTTITSGPANGSAQASRSASFGFTSPDATATFECRIDGAAFAACTSPQAYSSLTDGSHTFDVRAKDPAGNVDGTPASVTFTVDGTPPDTTITSGPAAGSSTNATTATFSFTSTETPQAFQCSLDGAAYASCTSPQSYSGLSATTHTFSVRAVDAVGNVDPTPASRSWTVDLTPPDTTITSAPSGSVGSTSATISFTATETGSTFQCQLDGVGFSACSSPVTLQGLSQGSHTYQVRAIDAAGNIDPTPASATWIVDTVAPDTTITSSPPAQTNQASATFAFSSNETGVTYECRLDGAASFSSCTNPVTFSGLADGTHSLDVRAKDAAGNTDPTPASFAWVIDRVAPDTTIASGPAAQSNSTSATFTFSSPDATATFECQLDAGGYSTCTSPRTLTGLTEGAHTFYARAKDPAGNVDPTPATYPWTVDLTAPDTTLLTTPPAQSNSTSATFTFSSPDATATFECQLDSGSFTACTTPYAVTGLLEGSHTFFVRAKDPAGNVDLTPASFPWTVDTTAPDTSITQSPPLQSNSTSATFAFASPDATATFQCQLDGAAFAACATPLSLTGLSQGSHTFNVRARDPAGNVDPTPATYSWTVDTTPPDTTITQSPPAQTNITTATFDFTSTEGGSTFECALDGAAFSTCTRPQTYSGLSAASHTFQVRARDQAGNADPTPASYTWVVDMTPPDTTITQQPAANSATSSATFAFTATKAGSTFECQLDGGAFAACTSPRAYSGLADGAHSFAVRARDPAGNVDPSPATAAWTIDTVAPDTSIVTGPPSQSSSASASFTLASNESNVTYECALDGAAFLACANPATFSTLTQGAHSLAVRAKDAAGNVDATPATYAWTVDTVAPDTTITSGPPATTNVNTASFSFTAPGEPASTTFQCQLDQGLFVACTSPQSYGSLAEGAHTFSVRARDAAGNVDPTPATQTWTVDTVAPDTAISQQPPAYSNSTSATFAFTSNEAVVTFECRLDGAATFTACATPITFSGLAQGNHTLQVRAKDGAGNVDATPAQASWIVDTVPPETTIVSGPPAMSNTGSATFTFSSDDPAATFECKLDTQATFTACTNPVTFNNVPQGNRTLSARAKDQAGNVDPTPATYSWAIGTGAPETFIVSSPPAIAASTSATFNLTSDQSMVTFECALDGAAFAACDPSVIYTGLAQGMHAFQARAKDTFGNVDQSPASFSWVVDTVAPDTTITSGPSAQSASTSATFSFTSTESNSTFDCALDGAAFGVCTSPTTVSGLAQGAHAFRVRARDAAGNLDATPAQASWTVDTIVPAAPVIATPTNNSATNTTSVGVTGTAEPGVTVRVFLDGLAAGTTLADGSGNWSVPLTGLGEGSHQLRAQAQDAAGNTSALSALTTFTVDTTAPAAPIVNQPANGTLTNQPRPVVTGTAEAGSTVTVSFDGATAGTTVAASNGLFSFTPTADLANGAHTVSATARDAAGNVSTASNTNSFNVDTQPPAAPVITAPTQGQLMNNARPTVTGTAESNAQVEVRVDGAVVGTVAANATGAWTYTLSAAQSLADGGHNVTARAADSAGNQGPASAPTNFTVDTTPPAAPTILAPTSGSRTNNTRPTITGTAEAFGQVRVTIDGVVYGTVFVNAGGNWSFTPSFAQSLSEGSHTVLAAAIDLAGNVGPASPPTSFTVDLTAPTPPQILTPVTGTRTNTAAPTVTGMAEPLSRVDLYVDGVAAGSAQADATGSWFVNLGALSDGLHTLTAKATDAAGNTSASSAPTTLTIDTAPPSAPVISTPADGSRTNDNTPDVTGTAEAGATITIFIDGTPRASAVASSGGSWIGTVTTALSDGLHVATARATDAAGNQGPTSASSSFTVDTSPPAAPIIVSPANGGSTNQRTPLVTGTTEPNATVRLYRDGNLVGTTTADGSGQWAMGLPTLADGTYGLRAQAIDLAGNVGPLSALTSFTVDTTPPTPPVIVLPADGSRVATGRPSVTGTAEPGSTVTVRFDGLVAGTALASLTGTFVFTPSTTLPDGAHNVTATATDPGGNVSDPSTPNAFVVDTVAPAAPVVTAPTSGQILATPRPTFRGTAEALSTVEVRVDGVLLGTAVASGVGGWSFTPSVSQSLADGTHTVTARAIDQANNTGPSSSPVSFVVDTQAPATPVVTAPASGSRTNNATPTVAGTAEPAATVTVLVDGATVGNVTADSNGAWSYVLTSAQALADGNHSASARATDAAGNASGASTPVSFVVDLTPPNPPVITAPADGARLSNPAPTVSGSAEPLSTVNVLVDGGLAATTTANGSGNWSVALPPQADGAHGLTARARDVAGNLSVPSATVNVTIDTLPPSAPVITSPASGAQLGTSTPTVRGTAEAGATLSLFDGATLLGTTLVAADGSWSFSVPLARALADGTHSLTARATDAAGNQGAASAAVNVIVDTAAPAAPVITSPTAGSVVNQPEPSITGTAEIGSTVTVTIDGVVIGSTTAGAGGLWFVSAATPIADGNHLASATATDAAGNVSPNATAVPFVIDTSAPSGVRIDSPVNGAQLATGTPTIIGGAEPLSTVHVYVDGAMIGTTTVDADGNWSFQPGTPLAEGAHTLAAQATDQGGNTGPMSTTITFVVDLTPPAAPTITAPASDARLNTTTPTITGTAGAGERVQVRIDGNLVGEVSADTTGAFSYTLTPAQALADGAHTATATSRDGAGNVSQPSASRSFVIDTVAPAAPVVTAPVAGSVSSNRSPTVGGTAEANATVRVLIDGNVVGTVTATGGGAWSYTLTAGQALAEGVHQASAIAIDSATNASQPAAPVAFTVDLTAPTPPAILTPAEGAQVATGRPTLTGTAEPGALVSISTGGTLLGTVVADLMGAWTFTLAPAQSLADGTYVFVATATDAAGNVSAASAPRSVVIDTTVPAAPAIATPTDHQILGSRTPTIAGTAEPNARVSISVDGTALGEAVADGSGAWSFSPTPAQALTDGQHTATATARDAAGNVSVPSSGRIFVVDTQPPAPPLVTSPTDGAHTNDTTPTISGTAEAGSTVEVQVDGVVVGTATTDSSGQWTFTVPTDLTEAAHIVTVRATDPAGNASGASTPITIVIDVTPPAPPVITAPPQGAATNDRTPDVRGTAEPGSTITVAVDGVPVGTTTTAPDGTWAFTVPDAAALTEGPHTITAESTDRAGNVSAAAEGVDITIDVTPPSLPIIDVPQSGASVATTTPTLSGSADPDVRVELRIDGVLVGTAIAGPAGAWSLTVPSSQAIGAGSHVVTATAVDSAGNSSGETAPRPFTVDVMVPAAPVIRAPVDGSSTNVAQPTVSGTATPGLTVSVYLNGRLLGTTVAAADGTWSYTLTADQALTEGAYVARATATNAAGTASAASTPIAFTVDTTAPNAPIIVAPSDGAVLGTARPTLRGTSEPNASVTILIGGSTVATVTADANGAWSYTLTAQQALADGMYSVTAVARDPAGNVSSSSPASNFTIDTAAPGRPTITAPIDGAFVGTSTPTFAGTAEPHARVRLRIDGNVVAEVSADASGAWSYPLTPGQALADGVHVATATAVDTAGNVSPESQPVGFTISTAAPQPPRISTPVDGARTASQRPEIRGTALPGTSVQVLIDGIVVATVPVDAGGNWSYTPASPLAEGAHVITAKTVDAAGNQSGSTAPVNVTIDVTPPTAPTVTNPVDGAISNNPTPTITGTSEAGASVSVTVDGHVVGIATADADGNWRYTLTQGQALPDGEHTVSAAATDAVGNVGPSSPESTFTVDTVVPTPPDIRAPANGAHTNDPTPTVSGTAEPGIHVLVYIDDVLVGQTTADADGHWSFTPSDAQALPDGHHTITARAKDPSGNQSVASAPVGIDVDTVAPSTPVITQPADGSIVMTGTPTFGGTAEPGTQVDVYIDGTFVGTATAGSDGHWTLTPSLGQALPDGQHQVTAQGRDPAGNLSGVSPPTSIIVQGAPLESPRITQPTSGARTSDATPDVKGTAPAGAIVEVFVDGMLVGSTTADGTGHWSFTIPLPLADGSHTLTARTRDGAGRASNPSNAVTIVVDTTAPASPTIDPQPPSTNDDTPTISGTAEPGAAVEVSVDGTPVGTVTANPDGTWSIDLPPQGDGSHTISVVAVDATGNRSPSVTAEINVDTTAPTPPLITSPEEGAMLLSNPLVTGTGIAGALLHLRLDGVELPPIRVRGDGSWSLSLPDSPILASGPHTLVAVQLDDLGNVSPESNTVHFSIGLAEGAAFTCSAPGSNAPGLGALWLAALALALAASRRRAARRSRR